MNVSYTQFKTLVIALGCLAVLLLPFWPYSRWGYFPTGVAVAGILFLLGMRAISRPSWCAGRRCAPALSKAGAEMPIGPSHEPQLPHRCARSRDMVRIHFPPVPRKDNPLRPRFERRQHRFFHVLCRIW